jgi:hypothetical protein
MNNKHYFTIILFVFTQFSYALNNEVVIISFDKPDKFTDFKLRDHRSNKDQERLMNEMEKFIHKSVAKTSFKGAQLKIIVTDVDMAGRFVYPGESIDLRTNIRNNSMDSVRVVKQSDRVHLDFYFEILDDKGKVLNQGKEHLSSMGLQLSRYSKLKYNRGNFNYVLPLFDEWLKSLSKSLPVN